MKKKKKQLIPLLAIGLMSLFVISCQKGKEPNLMEPETKSEQTIFDYDFSRFENDERAHACRLVVPDGESIPRGAALTSKLWKRGQVITVSFIGGSNYVRQKVIQYAKEWEEYANIKFVFVPAFGMIRVSFVKGAGSYSYLGKDALFIPINRETMNYGWFDENTSEMEFSRTTLHEFGHALGLVHEHQHPDVTLDWDREYVYAFFAAPPNNWTKEQVDFNLFKTYDRKDLTYNQYDERSIMHYPIAGRMINRETSTPVNTELSDGDKKIASIMYPFY